jgi:exodeoxyribonuclease VII small subunit
MGKKMPEAGSEPAPQQRPETFEAALGELEEIIQRMESGDVPLDESLRLYARGTFLISHCQQRLDTAEKQIEQLTRGKDGRLVAAPTE